MSGAVPSSSAPAAAGREAYERGDYAAALDLWRPLAEAGDAWAQWDIGILYFQGQGVPVDRAAAVEWWLKAGDQGLSAAATRLGFAYRDGAGVKKDEAQAARWFLRAAEAGDIDAASALRFAYFHGKGVPKDEAAAARWCRLAAEAGRAQDQAYLGWMLYTGRGVSQDSRQATEWWQKASQQGDAYAQFHLGVAYRRGDGIKRSNSKAVGLFRMAASRANAVDQNTREGKFRSMHGLGVALARGQGTPVDRSEAYAVLTLAIRGLSGIDNPVRRLAVIERGQLGIFISRIELRQARRLQKAWPVKLDARERRSTVWRRSLAMLMTAETWVRIIRFSFGASGYEKAVAEGRYADAITLRRTAYRALRQTLPTPYGGDVTSGAHYALLLSRIGPPLEAYHAAAIALDRLRRRQVPLLRRPHDRAQAEANQIYYALKCTLALLPAGTAPNAFRLAIGIPVTCRDLKPAKTHGWIASMFPIDQGRGLVFDAWMALEDPQLPRPENPIRERLGLHWGRSVGSRPWARRPR